MGRDATKAAGNPWYEARKTASEYDGRLCSREGAAELLGMSVSSVADAELGTTKCMPVDKAVLMAFDECVENPATYEYAKASCERTFRWLERCVAEHGRLNALPDTVNPGQMLFGINQGATFPDLRIWHMQQIARLDCDGYAIGGLAVGEPTQVMYDIIDAVEPYMPAEKPRYLMGVGTPSNIIEGVARGVDFFDCVMPSRNGRHGKLFTWEGTVNILNEKYRTDPSPISPSCGCPVCRSFSRAYLRHLFKADEVLALRFAVLHNLWFYNELAARIRQALDEGTFRQFRERYSGKLEQRV